MSDDIDTSDAYARAVISANRLTPPPDDRARLEATIRQFRTMADLLHDCAAARYAVPALTMNPVIGGSR